MSGLHDLLRKRLLRDVHVQSSFSKDKAMRSLETADAALSEVMRHARHRKIMGAFRYEQKEDDGLSYDEKAKLGMAKTYVQRMEDKISLYKKTGNLEYLADVFNYVVLEWRSPYHPDAHFESTERHD